MRAAAAAASPLQEAARPTAPAWGLRRGGTSGCEPNFVGGAGDVVPRHAKRDVWAWGESERDGWAPSIRFLNPKP